MAADLRRRSGAIAQRKSGEDDAPLAFRRATEAFRCAEYEQCRVLLQICEAVHGTVPGAVHLLRARLARIDGDVPAWHASARAAVALVSSNADRATALALRALAAKRLQLAETGRCFRDLDAYVNACAPTDVTNALYLLAADAWEDRDLPRAERLVARNLETLDDPESIALLGWIDVGRERYRRAGKRFLDALTRLRPSGDVDLRLRGRLIHAVAVVASETIDLRLGRRIRREYEEMVWPESSRLDRFNAVTCLRFLALLEGDIERAWALSREAISIAPRPTYVAIAETNAAVASDLLGDRHAHALQLKFAWNILRNERWSGTRAEERVALTNFMLEGAHTLPVEARKAVIIYRSLTAKADRSNALENDRRITAFEAFAAGRVDEASGRRADAIADYRRSLGIWNELGFTMRAALVAIDLRRLTADDAYRAPIDAALERAPSAWFARTAERALSVRVWPAQREVLARLLEGKSAKAIAVEMERSPFTVTNHTRKLFATFGVRSRDELRARCAELEITADTLRRTL